MLLVIVLLLVVVVVVTVGGDPGQLHHGDAAQHPQQVPPQQITNTTNKYTTNQADTDIDINNTSITNTTKPNKHNKCPQHLCLSQDMDSFSPGPLLGLAPAEPAHCGYQRVPAGENTSNDKYPQQGTLIATYRNV